MKRKITALLLSCFLMLLCCACSADQSADAVNNLGGLSALKDDEKQLGGLGSLRDAEESSSNSLSGLHEEASSEELNTETLPETTVETLPPETDLPSDAGTYDKILAQLRQFQTIVTISGMVGTDEIKTAVNQIRYDHPELFWLEGYTILTKPDSMELQFVLRYRDIEQKMKELSAAADEIIAQIPAGASDDEKMLFVHDYIIENTEYDFDGAASNADGVWATAYGCLINHSATCQGYSEAYQLIMQKLGFECGICSGIANNTPHCWNYILLNDHYYWIDVTWDDPISQTDIVIEDNLRYTYFLINDEMLLKTRTMDSDNLFIPNCNTLEDNYFYKNQRYLTEYSPEQISAILSQEKANHKAEIMFASDTAFRTAIQKLFGEDEIWNMDVVQESGSNLIYYADEQMCVLTIRC